MWLQARSGSITEPPGTRRPQTTPNQSERWALAGAIFGFFVKKPKKSGQPRKAPPRKGGQARRGAGRSHMSSAGNGSAEALSVFDMDANGKVSVVQTELQSFDSPMPSGWSSALRTCEYPEHSASAGIAVAAPCRQIHPSPWWSPGSLLTLEPEHGITGAPVRVRLGTRPGNPVDSGAGASCEQIANTAGPASRRLIHGLRAVFASTERARAAVPASRLDGGMRKAHGSAPARCRGRVGDAGKSTLCSCSSTQCWVAGFVAFLTLILVNLGCLGVSYPWPSPGATARAAAGALARLAWPGAPSALFVGDNQAASSPDILRLPCAAASRYCRMRAPPPSSSTHRGGQGPRPGAFAGSAKSGSPATFRYFAAWCFPSSFHLPTTATPVLLTLPPRPPPAREDIGISMRQLALARYFIGSIPADRRKSSSAQAPYRVPWSAAAVCRIDEAQTLPRHDMCRRVSASLIGLCVDPSSSGEKDDERLRVVGQQRRSRQCVGLAVVRGIDIARRALIHAARAGLTVSMVRGRFLLPAVFWRCQVRSKVCAVRDGGVDQDGVRLGNE